MCMTDCVYCTVVVGSCMCALTFHVFSTNRTNLHILRAKQFSKSGAIMYRFPANQGMLCRNLLSVNYAVCTHLCINVFIEGSYYKMLPVNGGFLHRSVIEKFPLCNRDTNILRYVYNYDTMKLLLIMIQRDSDYSVFRINQHYNILNNKNKVLVCDVCTRSSAISARDCVRAI